MTPRMAIAKAAIKTLMGEGDHYIDPAGTERMETPSGMVLPKPVADEFLNDVGDLSFEFKVTQLPNGMTEIDFCGAIPPPSPISRPKLPAVNRLRVAKHPGIDAIALDAIRIMAGVVTIFLITYVVSITLFGREFVHQLLFGK